MEDQTDILLESVSVAKSTADAARDNVRIQETALRQWLATKDWGLEWVEDNSIDITFDVVNPTQIPLWFDFVILKTEMEEKPAEGGAVWLVPNKAYPMRSRFSMTDEQKSRMEQGDFVISLECSICFRDAMKNHWQQKSDLTLIKTLGQTSVVESRTLIFDSTAPENRKNQSHHGE